MYLFFFFQQILTIYRYALETHSRLLYRRRGVLNRYRTTAFNPIYIASFARIVLLPRVEFEYKIYDNTVYGLSIVLCFQSGLS